MTRSDKQKLAETARILLSNTGSCTAEEITKKAYGDLPVPWRVLIPAVTKHLKEIKDILCAECSNLSLCLVCDKFFTKYKRRSPENREQAMDCLAVGNGNIAAGIYMASSINDFMLLASIELGKNISVGSVHRVVKTISDASDNGVIPTSDRDQLFVDMAREMLPERTVSPALVE